MRRHRALAAAGLLVGLLTPSFLGQTSAGAATTTYQRGPDPTWSSIQATTGPFAYATITLSNTQTPSTFGAATIYYPTDTSQGTFGGVAIAPGYTEKQSAISWWGPRLSSQGFV